MLKRLAFFLVLPAFALGDEPRKALSPAETRAAFLKQLDRPKVDPDVKEGATTKANGLVTTEFSFASEKKRDGTVERVPALLIRPEADGKHPCVIFLHGTGGNKEGMRSRMIEWAKSGMAAVAIDARYHGARVPGTKGSQAYVAAITKAWQAPASEMEHPFYWDTAWDLWRLVDVLQKRTDIDGKRIGMLGTSMGGIQTIFAAAGDERVAVVVPLIAAQSFRWSLENELWQGRAKTIQGTHEVAAKDLGEPRVNARVCRELWTKLLPGVLDQFDFPQLLPLMAGRAMYIANGDRDPNCPIEGAKIAIESARKAYSAAGCPGKLKVNIAKDTPHQITNEQWAEAKAWCEKWLK